MKKIEKINITCRLDKKDVNVLDKLAEQMDRDRSYLIKQAVSNYIALQKWQEEEVRLAQEEMKAGKGITLEELKADMKTWGK